MDGYCEVSKVKAQNALDNYEDDIQTAKLLEKKALDQHTEFSIKNQGAYWFGWEKPNVMDNWLKPKPVGSGGVVEDWILLKYLNSRENNLVALHRSGHDLPKFVSLSSLVMCCDSDYLLVSEKLAQFINDHNVKKFY